jgi:hypothetical protein
MISDSPYDVGAPVLTPLKGIIAGTAAALAMLILLALVQPVSGVSPVAWVALIGNMIAPGAETGLARVEPPLLRNGASLWGCNRPAGIAEYEF